MTSFRKIPANRLNALRSTGPKTQEGKHQSRRNALRHGLTSETVIDALKDTEDYRAFEAVTCAMGAHGAEAREMLGAGGRVEAIAIRTGLIMVWRVRTTSRADAHL